MAFPVVEEAVESSTATAATNHIVTLPTATAGQLLLVILDKGSTSATINAFAGLTELLDEALANGLYIAYRWMDGSEPASYTLVSSAATRSAQIAYRISGAENPATHPPQIGTTSSGTSLTPDPPASPTPAGGTADYLFIALFGKALEEADDDTWVNTPPTDYTPNPPRQKACGVAGTNLGGMIASAERQLNTGVAQNPGTFGIDVNSAWRAQTIIVHPAAPVAAEFDAALTGTATEASALSTAIQGAASLNASATLAAALTTEKRLNAALTGRATISVHRLVAGDLSYVQTDTASDYQPSGVDVYKKAIKDGTPGTTGVPVSFNDTFQREEVWFEMQPGDVNWNAGSAIVRLNVSSGNGAVVLNTIRVIHRPSGTTLGTLSSINQNLSTGIYEYVVDWDSYGSPQPTDYAGILCVLSAIVAPQSITFTPNQIIDTPLTPKPITLDVSLSSLATLAASLSTSIEAAATLAGSAALAGELETAITISSTLAASSSASADLASAITPATSLTASASLASELETEIALATALVASSTQSAALASAITAEAALNASATIATDLSTQIRFVAPLEASASLNAELTAAGGGAALFDASFSGAGALAASLLTAISLAAPLASGATLGASLDSEITLAASPAASSAISGSLSTAIPLGAGLDAEAAFVAALTTAVQTRAALDAEAALTADLATSIRFAAPLSSSATVVVQLTAGAVPTVDAALASQATLTSALSTAIRFRTALAGEAALAAQASTAIHLRAPLSATSTLTGALFAPRTFASSLAASSSLAAQLNTAIPVEVFFAGSSALVADLATAIEFAAALEGSAFVEGDVTISLYSSLLASASVHGGLTAFPRERDVIVVKDRERMIEIQSALRILRVNDRRRIVRVIKDSELGLFDPKTPAEQISYGFDIAPLLGAGGSIISIDSVTASRRGGTADPNPSAILNEPASFSGSLVIVPVRDGVNGTTYGLTVLVNTTVGLRALNGAFRVRSL